MPKYDYKCIACNTIIEFQRNFEEDREPSCCGSTMQRQWGGSVGVIFNGNGFYSTDNRK